MCRCVHTEQDRGTWGSKGMTTRVSHGQSGHRTTAKRRSRRPDGPMDKRSKATQHPGIETNQESEARQQGSRKEAGQDKEPIKNELGTTRQKQEKVIQCPIPFPQRITKWIGPLVPPGGLMPLQRYPKKVGPLAYTGWAAPRSRPNLGHPRPQRPPGPRCTDTVGGKRCAPS